MRNTADFLLSGALHQLDALGKVTLVIHSTLTRAQYNELTKLLSEQFMVTLDPWRSTKCDDRYHISIDPLCSWLVASIVNWCDQQDFKVEIEATFKRSVDA